MGPATGFHRHVPGIHRGFPRLGLLEPELCDTTVTPLVTEHRRLGSPVTGVRSRRRYHNSRRERNVLAPMLAATNLGPCVGPVIGGGAILATGNPR